MVETIGRRYELVQRGEAGLACDADGLALGPLPLVERGEGQVGWVAASPKAVEITLKLAYGDDDQTFARRRHAGLVRIAKAFDAGDLLCAGIEAVHLRLPPVSREAMRKLSALSSLSKSADAWRNEPRVPPGQTGGGQWTAGGGGQPKPMAEASPGRGAPKVDATVAKKTAFVAAHYADALRAAAVLHVPVENILGVSGLESGWGLSNFADHQNFFGVHYPAGRAISSIPTKRNANVRGAVFGSYAACLDWFIRVAGPSVRDKRGPEEFAAALQDSGRFGTDTGTGAKVPGCVKRVAATIRGLRSLLPNRGR